MTNATAARIDVPTPPRRAAALARRLRAGGPCLVFALAFTLAPTPARAFTPAEIDAAADVAEDVGLVATLADDAFQGRNNNTAGALNAQALLISELSAFADGLNAGQVGDAAYKQAFATTAIGTNILAVIPGTDLADEYVMIGGHYDHLGTGPGGVFNGATDNAAGAAAVVAVGRAIASLPTAPRRSIILALWDAEEDSLAGSAAFAATPLVPLSSIVAYINFDILGANLLPSLRDLSFAIGSESGGATLQAMVQTALADESTLDTTFLSRLFGQERSDHANFINAIPSVFFSDATGACYHTTDDDIDVVDIGKLRKQARIALRLAVALAETGAPPTLVATTILGNSYDDAVSLLSVIDGAIEDLALFTPAQQTLLLSHQATLGAIVADGPGLYVPGVDGAALITAALDALAALATLPCEGYIATETVPLGPAGLIAAALLGGMAVGLLSSRRRRTS